MIELFYQLRPEAFFLLSDNGPDIGREDPSDANWWANQDPPFLQALVENTSSVENEQVHSEQVSESLDMASWK